MISAYERLFIKKLLIMSCLMIFMMINFSHLSIIIQSTLRQSKVKVPTSNFHFTSWFLGCQIQNWYQLLGMSKKLTNEIRSKTFLCNVHGWNHSNYYKNSFLSFTDPADYFSVGNKKPIILADSVQQLWCGVNKRNNETHTNFASDLTVMLFYPRALQSTVSHRPYLPLKSFFYFWCCYLSKNNNPYKEAFRSVW